MCTQSLSLSKQPAPAPAEDGAKAGSVKSAASTPCLPQPQRVRPRRTAASAARRSAPRTETAGMCRGRALGAALCPWGLAFIQAAVCSSVGGSPEALVRRGAALNSCDNMSVVLCGAGGAHKGAAHEKKRSKKEVPGHTSQPRLNKHDIETMHARRAWWRFLVVLSARHALQWLPRMTRHSLVR